MASAVRHMFVLPHLQAFFSLSLSFGAVTLSEVQCCIRRRHLLPEVVTPPLIDRVVASSSSHDDFDIDCSEGGERGSG